MAYALTPCLWLVPVAMLTLLAFIPMADASVSAADRMAPRALDIDETHDDFAIGFCSAVTEIPSFECEGLVALYESTNGPGWGNRTGWLSSVTPCSWYGIQCADGHVLVLEMGGNYLTGALPPALGDLKELWGLYLPNNQLSGALPSQLGQLVNLKNLHLDSNQFDGTIPPQIGQLANLKYLNLSSNRFSGHIPPTMGTLGNLEYLHLYNNQLTGPIPAEMGSLTNVRVVTLQRNQLSGAIPPHLGNMVNLQALDLRDNRLTGTVPPHLGDLADLHSLDVSKNTLTGPLPYTFTTLELNSLAFDETGICEPPDLDFQAWIDTIPGLRSTDILCTTPGGRNLRITTGSIALHWDGGSAQSAYRLLKYNTSTTSAELIPLAGAVTTYTDYSTTNGVMYCYVLAPLNGPTVLGLSDLVCGMTGQQSGTVLPFHFALGLNQGGHATMTWVTPADNPPTATPTRTATPVAATPTRTATPLNPSPTPIVLPSPPGADSYLLQRIPLDGSPITNVPLGGAATSTVQAVTAAGTCFQLIAFKGAGFGTTNVLCGVPGVSSLSSGSAAGRTASDSLAEVTQRLQQVMLPGLQGVREVIGE